MIKELQQGKKGAWEISHFKITQHEAALFNIQQVFNYSGRHVLPGEYTRLTHEKRGVVMSDTPAEIREMYPLRHVLRMGNFQEGGIVHVNGLGLGIALSWFLEREDITDITVVEIDTDVLDLVGSQYRDKRITYVHADALQYQPPKGKRYDVVWHDIWDEISSDNWEQYKLLHRRWGRKTHWQDSWCRYYLKGEIRKYGR